MQSNATEEQLIKLRKDFLSELYLLHFITILPINRFYNYSKQELSLPRTNRSNRRTQST